MQELLETRRRYEALRRQLDLGSETDRGLHLCLTETIRALDDKIARLTRPRNAQAPRQAGATRQSA